MGWWVTVISSAGLGWCMAELGSDLRLTAPRANVNPAHTEKLCTDFRGGIFLNYMYCSLFYFIFYHEYCMVFFLSLNKVNTVLFWVLFVVVFLSLFSFILHKHQRNTFPLVSDLPCCLERGAFALRSPHYWRQPSPAHSFMAPHQKRSSKPGYLGFFSLSVLSE